MQDWKLKERDRLRKQIAEDTHTDDRGAVRWNSNDQCVPLFVYKDADLTPPAAQAEVDAEDTAKFIASYKRRQANRSSEQLAEERFEARAAHGPGVAMVNVLTGEKYTT